LIIRRLYTNLKKKFKIASYIPITVAFYRRMKDEYMMAHADSKKEFNPPYSPKSITSNEPMPTSPFGGQK
jgi:hypothetical protein